jgi:hypothetical protein
MLVRDQKELIKSSSDFRQINVWNENAVNQNQVVLIRYRCLGEIREDFLSRIESITEAGYIIFEHLYARFARSSDDDNEDYNPWQSFSDANCDPYLKRIPTQFEKASFCERLKMFDLGNDFQNID